MPNFDFEKWLERHNELVEEALNLFLKRKLNATIINEKKVSFIRVFFGTKKVDFHVKEINTKMSGMVWLCKRDSFDVDKNYLLKTKREKFWIMATGADAKREGEYRDSEWQEGVQYLVVPMEIFKPAKTFIKLMKIRLDSQIQKRITEFG